jgi:hypothetical protein
VAEERRIFEAEKAAAGKSLMPENARLDPLFCQRFINASWV